VLDLFAGTGALGIEALSRGAERAVFVDSDRRSCELVQANLNLCGFAGQARIERREALRFLGRPVPEAPFDLVLIDPPYGQGLLIDCLEALAARGLLAATARVFCEAEAGLEPVPVAGCLRLGRAKRYGDTAVFEYLPGA
jgi:16S rRNA (guanine966-N2)-methyltransferase